MPQYVIGIDLGAHAAKAVVAERSFRGLEIHSFHEFPVSDAGNAYPIAELLDSVKRTGATYAARVPGDRVALRVMNLPFGDSRTIAQVIPGEVEAVLPFALDDIVYDTHIAEKGSDGSRVVVAAVRNEDVASCLAPLTEHGVDPRVLDAEPLGLAALAAVEPGLREGNALLVDAGHRRTGLVALEGGNAVFGRTLATGASALIRALTTDGSLDMQRAQTLLRGGIVEASENPADALLYRAARGLAQEIARTILAMTRTGAKRPDRIVLVGGLSLVPGFAQLLETSCRLPTHLLELTSLELGADKLQPGELPRAAAALSLAARAAGEAKQIDINLRKNAFTYQRDTQELGGFLSRAAIAAAVLLVLAGVDLGVKSQMLRSERKSVRAQISAKVQPVVPDADPGRLADDTDYAVSVLSNEVKNLRRQVATLEGTSVSGLEVLKEVSGRIPPEATIDVSRFDFGNGQLRLEGTADSFTSIDKVIEALKAEPHFFTDVEVLNRGSDSGSDKKSFKIRAETGEQETE